MRQKKLVEKMATISGLGKRELRAELKDAVKGNIATSHRCCTIYYYQSCYWSVFSDRWRQDDE